MRNANIQLDLHLRVSATKTQTSFVPKINQLPEISRNKCTYKTKERLEKILIESDEQYSSPQKDMCESTESIENSHRKALQYSKILDQFHSQESVTAKKRLEKKRNKHTQVQRMAEDPRVSNSTFDYETHHNEFSIHKNLSPWIKDARQEFKHLS